MSEITLPQTSGTRALRVAAALKRAIAENRGKPTVVSPYGLHHRYGGPVPQVVGVVMREERAEVERLLDRSLTYAEAPTGGMFIAVGAKR